MSLGVILISAVFVILQRIRYGLFHTAVFWIHDPIFYCIGKHNSPKKVIISKLLCNLFFIAGCAFSVFVFGPCLIGFSESDVLWGIALGAFCTVWPTVYFFRLYSFWKNLTALVHFYLNIGEIVYAVCMAKLFFTANPVYLLSLIIPISAGLLRRWSDEVHSDCFTEITTEANQRIMYQKIAVLEKRFSQKYGADISRACEAYRIPSDFFTRFILVQQSLQGNWYHSWYKLLFSRFFPRLCLKANISLGVCFVKPKTAIRYCGASPETVVRELSVPAENIRLAACYIRAIIDGYPGNSTAFGSEARKLCHYVVCMYNTGMTYVPFDFADIFTDVLMNCGADKLSQNGEDK